MHIRIGLGMARKCYQEQEEVFNEPELHGSMIFSFVQERWNCNNAVRTRTSNSGVDASVLASLKNDLLAPVGEMIGLEGILVDSFSKMKSGSQYYNSFDWRDP